MKTFFLSLMLVSIPSMAEASEISLDILYYRLGEKICEERITVQADEAYQVCEKDFHGKRNWLRIAAFPEENGKQIKLAMAMEELEDGSRVKVLSSPTVIVNDGVKAEMTNGSSKDGKYLELEDIVVIPKVER